MNLFKKLKRQSAFTLLIYFFVTLVNPVNGQTPNAEEEIKLGLVLSGGGAKGFAHIGEYSYYSYFWQ